MVVADGVTTLSGAAVRTRWLVGSGAHTLLDKSPGNHGFTPPNAATHHQDSHPTPRTGALYTSLDAQIMRAVIATRARCAPGPSPTTTTARRRPKRHAQSDPSPKPPRTPIQRHKRGSPRKRREAKLPNEAIFHSSNRPAQSGPAGSEGMPLLSSNAIARLHDSDLWTRVDNRLRRKQRKGGKESGYFALLVPVAAGGADGAGRSTACPTTGR